MMLQLLFVHKTRKLRWVSSVVRHQLQANGIAGEPPAGWLPDSPDHRALVTGEPPTAP